MNEPKRPPEQNSGSQGGYTTGDLRKHAEDALRRLREKNVLPPAPTAPETETLEMGGQIGNTTHDLGREAQKAMMQQSTTPPPLAPMTTVPNGTQEFTETMVLRFDVSESTAPLIVDTIVAEMVLGRGDSATAYTPEIDLTRYGAYRLGLSRRHAIIRCQGNMLYLMDLGGRNGTALNGHRLDANQNCLLSSGDEITLGNLRMRVTYQKR
jgi:hypothetical protein